MDVKKLLITYIIMFTFWILLSWTFDILHITAGLIGSFLVAYVSHDLLIKEGIHLTIKRITLIIRYLMYLVYSIVVANLDVAYRVLHPKMPIDPKIIRFKSKLRTDVGKTSLANSITLTPGTITIDVKDENFYVHALSSKAAEDFLKGSMRERLHEIFEEGSR
jgi:multicomponent Na+:H+ antiporter subunit E